MFKALGVILSLGVSYPIHSAYADPYQDGFVRYARDIQLFLKKYSDSIDTPYRAKKFDEVFKRWTFTSMAAPFAGSSVDPCIQGIKSNRGKKALLFSQVCWDEAKTSRQRWSLSAHWLALVMGIADADRMQSGHLTDQAFAIAPVISVPEYFVQRCISDPVGNDLCSNPDGSATIKLPLLKDAHGRQGFAFEGSDTREVCRQLGFEDFVPNSAVYSSALAKFEEFKNPGPWRTAAADSTFSRYDHRQKNFISLIQCTDHPLRGIPADTYEVDSAHSSAGEVVLVKLSYGNLRTLQFAPESDLDGICRIFGFLSSKKDSVQVGTDEFRIPAVTVDKDGVFNGYAPLDIESREIIQSLTCAL